MSNFNIMQRRSKLEKISHRFHDVLDLSDDAIDYALSQLIYVQRLASNADMEQYRSHLELQLQQKKLITNDLSTEQFVGLMLILDFEEIAGIWQNPYTIDDGTTSYYK